ncbi:hypothetical protein B5G26_15555 [Anaerotignum lactatifermentans]|uniref:Uncharacterized protein n=1 Tax=Anaerotignum lactatifermentans TaxID=160404 RepID=A0A1Y3U1P1_9FIRM|nr:hypothetical protein B5G26_15555 [Anaerotignum lactatifermentans]
MDSGCICFFMKKFLENLLFSRKVTLEKRKLLWFFAGGKQTEGGKDGLLFGRESQNLRKNQIFSPQSVYFY